ncbi:MAG: hypothetical protein CBD18_01275 [Opitutales bacterium TMED158]|nr:MAG: hypothetical protein CBD18_01275 [Opitutales bacterium TMED158]
MNCYYPSPLLFRALALTICLGAFLGFRAVASDDFELRHGDRVAFLGDAFFERAIRYGHIETALTARWPERSIRFRNIGWAGDGPNGRARAFFDPVDAGFENLKTHVEIADPSVVFLGYGAMAAFDGEPGLDSFIDQMNALLDALQESGRRFVILSPNPRENLGPPLPDPERQNRNLKRYTAALKTLAENRGAFFVDLFNTLEARSPKRDTRAITDNGIHLNDYGYRLAAERIAQALTAAAALTRIAVDRVGNPSESAGAMATIRKEKDGYSLEIQNERLSLSPLGGDHSQNLTLSFANLARGEYELLYDGEPVANGSAQAWKRGIQLAWEPSNDQAQSLREAINRKNEHFFHQWRPQNETYIRGFRKHEQGQNATDIPKFQPFIEGEEMKIEALKKPQAYRLVLKRVKGDRG